MAAGGAAAGLGAPCVLGVTVLTSETDAPAGLLAERAALAAAAGCGGLVCAAADLAVTRAAAPGLITVVPGIRPAGVAADDQARAADPAGAIGAGADILVIGRAVTAAGDPEAAAAAVAGEVAAAVDPLRG
jgi:orotidine-5'-phosphate decarboxylase